MIRVAAKERRAVVVFQITRGARGLARKLKDGLGSDVEIKPAAAIKRDGLGALVKKAFVGSKALVFIGSTGIAVRSIAPFIKSKTVDPAVVVIDDSARFAVSLLSGHLGGANDLASACAKITGATAVITTATDSAGRPCAEDIAKQFSLAIENIAAIKKVNSTILESNRVIVADENSQRRADMEQVFGGFKGFVFKPAFKGTFKATDAFIHITAFSKAPPSRFAARTLVMRPREFVLGIGCNRGVSLKELNAAVELTLTRAGVSAGALRNIATIDVKSDEAAILSYAKSKALNIDFFSAKELNTVKAPSGPSSAAYKATGAKSVCEAAAMLSAGVKILWIKKTISGRVTTALARVRFSS